MGFLEEATRDLHTKGQGGVSQARQGGHVPTEWTHMGPTVGQVLFVPSSWAGASSANTRELKDPARPGPALPWPQQRDKSLLWEEIPETASLLCPRLQGVGAGLSPGKKS